MGPGFIFQIIYKLLLVVPCRESDDSDVRKKMKYKARWKSHPPSAIRAVNFAIFVVSGVTILKSLEEKDDHDGSYMDMVAATYNLPYLSFRGTLSFFISLDIIKISNNCFQYMYIC